MTILLILALLIAGPAMADYTPVPPPGEDLRLDRIPDALSGDVLGVPCRICLPVDDELDDELEWKYAFGWSKGRWHFRHFKHPHHDHRQVPEPSTGLLLASSLIGLWRYGRPRDED
jgi:hypothetical protein